MLSVIYNHHKQKQFEVTVLNSDINKDAIIIISDRKGFTACIKPVGADSEKDMPVLLRHALAAEDQDGTPENKKGSDFLCVHRLDKAVSGVMIYAKHSGSAAFISQQIQDGSFVKEYYAVVSGRPEPESGTMEDLLFKDSTRSRSFPVKRMRKGVKKASLEYRTLCSVDNEGETATLVKVKLHTGRYHQIRVQFASRKMPLLGDGKYGSRDKKCTTALFSCSITMKPSKKAPEETFTAVPEMTYPWNLFPAEAYL